MDATERGGVPMHRKRWPRWARVTRAVVIVAAILMLAGFFAAPPVVRSVLEKQLTAQLSTPETRRVAHIGKVRINPLALSCAIEGFSITAENREPLVGWRRLHASLDLRTLFTRTWRFREIALDGFGGHIAISRDGRLNFSDLLQTHAHAQTETQTPATTTADADNATATDAATTPAGKSRALHINRLVVTDAHLDFDDASRAKPFSSTLGPVSFTATDLQTGGPDRAPGEFAATTESGETLSWRGSLSMAPLYSKGEIRIGNLDVKKYAPYYDRYVRFDVLEGALDLTLSYEVAQEGEGGPLAARARESAVTLRNPKLAARGQTRPAIALETLALEGISANANGSAAASAGAAATAAAPDVRIERIRLENGAVALRRTAPGLNLAELFTPAAAASQTPPHAASAPATQKNAPAGSAPDISVGELTLRNITVAFEDATLETPAHATLLLTTFDAKNFTLGDLSTPLTLALSAQLEHTGQLRASGKLALSPLAGSLNIDWANLPLATANPYLAGIADARIAAGAFSGTAEITLTPRAPQTAMTVAARAGVTDFAMTGATGDAPLQSWKQLDVNQITFTTGDTRDATTAATTPPRPTLSIGEIVLDGAQTHVLRQAGGTLNLASIRKKTAPAETPAPAPPPSPPGLSITIAKVLLADSRVDFTDHSVEPQVRMSLDNIAGSLTGLSSENLAHANVDISAKINGLAPVTLTGQINPLSDDTYTDLTLTLRNAELAPLDSYVSKYAGRKLAGGTLNIDVTTKLSKRFLDSSNVITLDQFAFGERVDSPDATKLPLGLAVALLRDTHGKIVIDVPVQGSLDDPEFRYGRAVWRAVGNLVIKAATAPFALLGSMFGIGGSPAGGAATAAAAGGAETDLSVAEFDAGAGAPDEAGLRKLAIVAKALRERPALQLALLGGFDASADANALRKLAFLRQLKQEYWAELGGSPGVSAAAAAEQIELPPDAESRLVGRLYQRHFAVEERTGANAPSPASPAAPLAAVVTSSDTLPTPDEMREKLLAMIPVSEAELRQLAAVRAESVREYLVTEGGVPAAQVVILPDPAPGTLVSLQLR